MFSDLLDVLGLAALVAGVFVLAGLGWMLLALGVALLFTAQGVNDEGVNKTVARVVARARARASHLASAPQRLAARRKVKAA